MLFIRFALYGCLLIFLVMKPTFFIVSGGLSRSVVTCGKVTASLLYPSLHQKSLKRKERNTAQSFSQPKQWGMRSCYLEEPRGH